MWQVVPESYSLTWQEGVGPPFISMAMFSELTAGAVQLMDTSSSTSSAQDSSRSQTSSNTSSSVTKNQSSPLPSSSLSSKGSADSSPGMDSSSPESSWTPKMPFSESLSPSATWAALVGFFLLPVFLWKAARWSVDLHSQHFSGFCLLFLRHPWPPLPHPRDSPPCATAIASSRSQSFASPHVGYFAF